MAAVSLAVLAGVIVGALGLALRKGLVKVPDPELGAFVSVAIGFVVVLILTAGFGQLGDVRFEQVWPFLAIGVIVPGLSQILFLRGVRDLGPSRHLVVMSTGPLFAAVAAIALLSEPMTLALAAGTLLVLGGGATLAWERQRPSHFRLIGVVWALATAGLFASRDILGRWLMGGEATPPLIATAALLASATLTLLIYLCVTRRRTPLLRPIARSAAPFLTAGVLFGVGYAVLLAALDNGPVTIVSPLFGTYALWGVLFSLVLIRKAEAISSRTAISAVLVASGIGVIGVTH